MNTLLEKAVAAFRQMIQCRDRPELYGEFAPLRHDAFEPKLAGMRKDRSRCAVLPTPSAGCSTKRRPSSPALIAMRPPPRIGLAFPGSTVEPSTNTGIVQVP